MKPRKWTRRNWTLLLLFLTAWWTSAEVGSCERISKEEAIAAADLWYAMEINDEHSRLDTGEKAKRLASIRERQVLYLVSQDDLRSELPKEGVVMAFVVKYKPAGFVIVSGDDRIDPVLVFSAESRFNFNQPERNFLRHYLAKALAGRWNRMAKQPTVHPEWIRLRSRLKARQSLQNAVFGPGRSSRSVYVYWDTPLWDQYWPYNETVQVANGNIGGIPTGCTATAMAIQMRFHEWPLKGYDSHGYKDNEGSVQFNHAVDFGKQTYNWSAMPMGNLTSPNSHVADLMYHCGVAVEMNYEVGNSTAWPSAYAMNQYYRYKGTVENTWNHEPHIANSVIAGCPVILSSSDHTVVAAGYRDYPSPYFYLNAGWGGGGSNTWYNLDQIPGGDPTVDRSYPYSSPNNYMYVYWGSPGPEYGTIQLPFNTLSEGHAAVPSGGKLWIYEGTYSGAGNVPVTFDKAMEIKTYGGAVTIE